MEPTVKPDLFGYSINAGQAELSNSFRRELQKVCERLAANMPNSRERSLAITKLEEASMWIDKAIALTVK